MNSTLALEITKPLRARKGLVHVATEVGLVSAGTVLLVALAQVVIPIVPVPITGQSLGVLLVAAALGWQRGTASVLAYLLLGAAGAPVFAAGVGPAAFIGPTGGYLLSFIPAAMAVGWLAERGLDRSLPGAWFTFFVGHAIIFGIGVSFLAFQLGWPTAVESGLMPFIPGALIKTLVATGLLPLAWSLNSWVRQRDESDASQDSSI